MSIVKKTITIPSSVGSANLAETFGKITLSSEMKELLSALEAEFVVRYIPGAEKPVLAIKAGNGKLMCSLEEFKALSGYRRFVTGELKEIDKKTSNAEKLKLIGFFLRVARTDGVPIPQRIVESNLSKFNQLGMGIEMIKHHLEVIGNTIDNTWKDYLKIQASLIMRVLYATQVSCMGPTAVGREVVEDSIYDIGVPKWLYTKFLDKNFTNNLKTDSMTLLFPKGNYLKAIALTTKEIKNESFLTQNKIVLEKCGGMIAIAKTDYSELFPAYPAEMNDQVESFLAKYQWVCTNPSTSEEILAQRESGKTPPIFREAQASRSSGQNQRPETESARVCRAIANTLGKIQATWNGIMNFVIPVASPKNDFWIDIFPNANNWEITPTNSIYNSIRNEETAIGVLDGIRGASSTTVLERIGNIIAQVLMIPYGTKDCKVVTDSIMTINNRQGFREHDAANNATGKYPMANLAAMENQPTTDEEIGYAKEFLGIQDHATKKVKKSGGSAVRLDSSVLNELSLIKGEEIYEPVVHWLMTTFKTGSRAKLQLVAAERILGEALKHQDKLFDEEVDEADLQELEGYYEEE